LLVKEKSGATDRQTAIKLIRETFENPFDRGRFINLSKNLVKRLDTSKNFTYRGNIVPDAYKQRVQSLERVGKYEDADGNKIEIIIVRLAKERSIERARTMQRNFVAWYLNGSRGGEQKDAALAAFVSPDSRDWRFSLVKMEYSLEAPGKVETELTPAQRYSFLVGENESSHTAQVQLLPILQDDDRRPLLSDFEKAFSIEVVTREFFVKYRELFHDVDEALQKELERNTAARQDFEAKGVDTVDFAKKLLGQIVFLYFLQKKGWFGVGRDDDWGTGPKDFLRRLFYMRIVPYQNFFNDILEPLFYNALATEKTDDFYDRFNCKIPFLNGGLFDPINGYDWVHMDMLLPNELFSNSEKTREGDTGTGILDVFDRYNFTVREDEPLDKEVAVDPEMLGKVFENLLEVKDRKSKGTYYTPREIVHYMCQESLINYLDTALNTGDVPLVTKRPPQGKLFGSPDPEQGALTIPGYQAKVPRTDIEALIRTGELAIDHDTQVEAQARETGRYSYRLPESIRWNAEVIDRKLADIRVCDPAIGSGAFPVGLMTEIVRARNTLTVYLPDKEGRSNYDFKRHAIQSCLYGVDIDPGAVEIAKLRLWLSLVVDEEDIKQIQPLPNLDYKIVCGNSLLKCEQDILYWPLFEELEKLKVAYFSETSRGKKEEYRRRIGAFMERIEQDGRDFNFTVHFSEVFPRGNNTDDRGFDVVVANPPYIRQEQLKELKPELKKYFECYDGAADIYVYFYERGRQ
ncbi:MAG: Eco57I restriction-modification methylase domain-containing protein, partial [Dehalococcoidia bacterium]|nr:Eco57I restriction-modification methylase domain-containing protein [Dehalococcoidia bacterium]